MGLRIGGGGGTADPYRNLPALVTEEAVAGHISELTIRFPVFDSAGNVLVFPPDSASGITLVDDQGASTWAVVPTDINASATNWAGPVHYDTTDDAFWIFARSATVVYPAKVDRAAGTVTAVGSGFTPSTLIDGALSAYHIERAAAGSGDFTITSAARTWVVNSSTGALTSETALPLNRGCSAYITADGSVQCDLNVVGTSGGVSGSTVSIDFWAQSSGGADIRATVAVPPNVGMYVISSNAATYIYPPKLWGGRVVLGDGFTGARNRLTTTAWFTRASFDEWLKTLIRAAGHGIA